MHTRLVLAAGGVVDMEACFRDTNFVITGLSFYLITSIFVLILKEVVYV